MRLILLKSARQSSTEVVLFIVNEVKMRFSLGGHGVTALPLLLQPHVVELFAGIGTGGGAAGQVGGVVPVAQGGVVR